MGFTERFNAFPKLVGWRVKQVREEAEFVYGVLARRKPAVFLEIGSAFGGTLYLYGEHSPTIVSVDTGQFSDALAITAGALVREGHEVHLVRGKSQKPTTVSAVAKVLSGRKIDFLHVDGAHATKAVLADWHNYRKFLTGNSIAAFHDLKYRKAGVHRAWPQVRGEYWMEVVGPDSPRSGTIGIGLIFLQVPTWL